jgi:hypothetical protein
MHHVHTEDKILLAHKNWNKLQLCQCAFRHCVRCVHIYEKAALKSQELFMA